MNFLYEEKITGDMGEEIILKNGVPSLYNDRTHLYISPGYAGLTGQIVVDTYGNGGAHCGGQVYCSHMQTAMSVM